MFEAIGDKILVQIYKREKTQGGLVLPVASNDPQAYGVVMSYGADITFIAEKGDYLVFHQRAGQVVTNEQIIMRVLKSDEVYGRLTDENLKKNLVPEKIG